jgi:hypothetical protein
VAEVQWWQQAAATPWQQRGRGGSGGAVSLLLNLEAARQGMSVLFSDEQKLLFEGGKRGLLRTPNWIL